MIIKTIILYQRNEKNTTSINISSISNKETIRSEKEQARSTTTPSRT